MLNDYLYNEIIKTLVFEPLDNQKTLIKKLCDFALDEQGEQTVFLINGYAGTGKTSIIAGFIKVLDRHKLNTVLMAPTGRAAKVLSSYAGKQSFTVHKKIYRQTSAGSDQDKFVLDVNLQKNTLFFIDEASMISNESPDNTIFGSGRMLDDVIRFIYNGKNCKLVLIGDQAQLPPVKLDLSPALKAKEFNQFNLSVTEHELTDVIRQEKASGTLFNATYIRTLIQQSESRTFGFPKLKLKGFTDLKRINGIDLIETITDAYDKYGIEDTVIICRSNKQANKYNQGIRNMIFFKENEISSGDMVMIVKNNYFWTEGIENIDFIANGDIAEIKKIHRYTERYGFRFADVTLQFHDYNDIEIKAKVLLDTLASESASLTSEQSLRLYKTIEEDFLDIANKKSRYKKIREHEFFNALQIKFAYAVTCHKAQGGQWKKVMVDQGYITKEMITKEYLRWLYTAFTRTTKELDLINFSDEFFES
jgi:exodeoxyribonuclease V